METNARTVATFAAAMMRALAEIDFEAMDIVENASDYFKLRVGMSAGPVIAGVVGANKPLYDIWGNTVNVASRMECLGHMGKIQCPAETAQYLGKANIRCTFRDVIFVKGKGNMHTYFVDLTGTFIALIHIAQALFLTIYFLVTSGLLPCLSQTILKPEPEFLILYLQFNQKLFKINWVIYSLVFIHKYHS